MSIHNDLIDSYKQMGALLEAQGGQPAALQTYQKCLILVQDLAEKSPDVTEWSQEMIFCLRKISTLQQALGQPVLALEALQRSITVSERLALGGNSAINAAAKVTAAEPQSFAQRFPKYWALGSQGTFSCWRWSNVSREEALRNAEARAAEMAAIFDRDGKFEQKYFYLDKPVREPLIEVVGEAVVSRNAYGCLVLNSPNAMFVDIDFPPYEKPGLFRQLFGGSEPSAFDAHMLAHQRLAMERVTKWTEKHPGWGWRAYRTFAGLRLLATHAVFEPGVIGTEKVLEELGSDPLYSKLCRIQKCFRARLTPKPWRCGLKAPEIRWPWPSEGGDLESGLKAPKAQWPFTSEDREEGGERFAAWQAEYELKSSAFSTCQLVGSIGSNEVHPALVNLVAHHDAATGVGTNRPLA